MFLKYLFLLVCIVSWCDGVYFDLSQGETRCFYEELNADDTVLLYYRCPALGSGKRFSDIPRIPGLGVELVVSDSEGFAVHRDVLAKGEDAFEFSSLDLPGEHSICFRTNTSTGDQKVRFWLSISSGADVDHADSGASLTSLDNIKKKISHMKAEMDEIKTEMQHFRARTDRFRQTSDSTFTRVWVLGLLQVLCVVTSALYGVYSLKSFLISKKLV